MKNKKSKAGSFQKDHKTPGCFISPGIDTTLQKRWVELTFLGILFLIALLVRLSVLTYYRIPLAGDAAIYGKIAWGIKTGHGLHWWSVVWSPFYPFMTFLFSLFTKDLESASYAVSVFLGSLTVVPFFYLAKKILAYPTAYLGTLLVVFFPASVVISAVPLSEATYSFFLMLALLCGWLLLSKKSYLYAVLFGILGGICYLTRPEFLVAFAFFLLLFLVIGLKRRIEKKAQTMIMLIVSLCGFSILALPYIGFMHSQTGHWILSGKTAHNILKQYAYSGEDNYLKMRKSFAEVLDGLTPDGEVKGKVLLGKESMTGLLTTPGFFGNYLKRTLAGIKKVNSFFLLFFLPSLYYLFSWKLDKEGGVKRIFLLCAFTPLLTMPIFFSPSGRLVEPYSPLLVMLSVAGIINLKNTLTAYVRRPVVPKKIRLGSLVILSTVAFLSIFSWAETTRKADDYANQFQSIKRGTEEFKQLGLWADRNLPPGAVVMFLTGDTFFFYCNRVTYTVPYAPFESIIEFAKKNKIDYLVISLGKEASWREDLTFLLEPLVDPSKTPEDSRLKLEDIYQAPSGLGAVVYKFEY